MEKIINKIFKDLKSKFFFNYDISKNIWFRTGGKVNIFCLVYDEKELSFILKNIGNTKYEIIGAGSNILIRDKGFDGIIFKLGKNFNKIILHESHIEVGAANLDINLSKFTQMHNIINFEFYSGIPGTIGGAIKMNAGCYGSETKDVLKEVKIINTKGEIDLINANDIDLKYRKSNLPKKSIIVSGNFNYLYGDKDEIIKKIKLIKINRQKSQPLQTKTGGSTFKNPNGFYAAKLIDLCECKGLSIGDAVVSKKHANFLINTNNASAKEIEDLGKKIIDRVYKKFDIKLEWEIKIIGD